MAQTELDIPVEEFHIGTLIEGDPILLDQESGFQNWIVSHTAPGYRATVSNFNGELVYSELFGWNYQASWSEGSYSFLMRFQLIQNGEKLRLLEVGSYQTCICEGCTGLSFHKNIPGCNSDGAPAEFLMGETLH